MAGDTSYPKFIQDEVEDPDGMSVFQIHDDSTTKRVASALLLIRDIKTFHGLIISEDLITNNGFEVRHSPDDVELFDPTLFKRHHDLFQKGGGSSQAFAAALALKAKRVIFESRILFQFIQNEVTAGRWQRAHVFREADKPETKRLMVRHWKARYLELNHP